MPPDTNLFIYSQSARSSMPPSAVTVTQSMFAGTVAGVLDQSRRQDENKEVDAAIELRESRNARPATSVTPKHTDPHRGER